MIGESNIQRGILLLQRRRPSEAEKEFRQALTANPQDGRAHSFLALALTAQNKQKEAIDEAQQGVGLAPYSGYSFHVLAMVLYHADRNKEALAAVEEALRIEPEDADYYEMQAKIYYDMEDWPRTLEAARQGLSVDPQHVDCANLEAMALVKLGRKGEASVAIETNLHRDPENAMTHATNGWARLHAGDHEAAFEHFREALRLNPNLEYARHGIVEAMKARNFLYRPILGYFLWMSRMNPRTRWMLILGLFFGVRFLNTMMRANPSLAPFIQPVIFLYLVFVFMSWIAIPLFNLVLRLDRYGRQVLSREETIASNWLGLCVFGGLGALLVGLLTRSGPMNMAGIGLFAMTLPVAGIFQAKARSGRIVLALYSAGLALVGAFAVLTAFSDMEMGMGIGGLFIIGWALYTWFGNLVINKP